MVAMLHLAIKEKIKDFLLIEGIHQPIISEEVFELVQKIHKKRIRKFRIYRNFLFGGLMNCKECGYKMTPCFTNKWSEGKLKRYFYYRCTSTTHKGWKACPIKQVSADRLEKYVLENLERISLDRNYVENLVFKLNHGLRSSNPELKNLDLPHRARYELSKVCSKSFQFSVENIISILKSFLSLLSQRKGIERNLLAKKFIKGIFYSKENIKITLFYSEDPKNLEFFQIKESPACRQAGGANLSDEIEIKSLKSPQNEFVAYDSGCLSWTKSELTLRKILMLTFNASPRGARAGGTKPDGERPKIIFPSSLFNFCPLAEISVMS